MPTYIEDNTVSTVVDSSPRLIKPILYTTYTSITKYDICITYEDSTVKNVELVQKNKERPYKFVYKKEGELLSVIGIPTVYEINEGNKFTDFTNKVLDASDLLFEVDASEKFECSKARFYLKDVRDIIDLAVDGLVDPEDPMDIIPITQYPIYLNNHSCESVCKINVDDSMITVLNFEITKMGDPLPEDQYSDFTVLSISDQDIIYEVTKNNKVTLYMTEQTLDKEIKIIVKYFIKEINHPVFDEFTIVVSKKTNDADEDIELSKAVSTQDMQYLGDGLEPALGTGLTPGYKPYKYRKSRKK